MVVTKEIKFLLKADWNSAFTSGKEEALSNIKEAIDLYLEPVEDDFTPSSNTEIIEVAV